MPPRGVPGIPGRTFPRLDRGFTLIEILVTLVILSTGIVAVLEAYQTSLSALVAGRERVRSAMLAAARMAEIDAHVVPAEAGRGRFPEPFSDYDWELVVDTASGVDTALPRDMKMVTLRVGRGRSPSDAMLTTYMRLP